MLSDPTESASSNDRSLAPDLFGDSELGRLCRDFDWSRTPLGAVDGWSQSLRTTVATVLRSRHPMFLFWGPELVQFYNDGYRPSLGEGGRHPRALGMRGSAFWTEIWDIIGPQIDGVMRRGEATWHEDQLVAIERNGRIEEVYWTYSYSPVRDDDGSIGGTLVVCQETTPRVIAERRLRTLHAVSELHPRGSAANAAQEALDVVASDRLDVPFALCYLTQRSAPDATPSLSCAAGVGDVPAERWPIRQAMDSGEPVPVDVRGWPEVAGIGPWPESPETAVVLPLRTSSEEQPLGALVVGISARLPWSESYREFLSGAARHVAGKVMADHIEHERTLRRRELELERSRLAFVFEHAPAFLAVLRGPSHVFELVNDAYCRLVGHRDVLGKPALEALPEIRNQGFAELLDEVLATGRPFIGREVAVDLVRAPGEAPEKRYLDFVYMPITEADGSHSGVIAHGADVTVQVRARREVERLLGESEAARAEAESANNAKSRFLATISHELRTPINAILGYAALLDHGVQGQLSPDQSTSVARIRASGQHLAALVNDILDLSRIESGALPVAADEVRVDETVGEAIDMIRNQASAKELEIVTDFEPGCPNACRGDPDRTRQILANLLANAVKFGGANARIGIRCRIEQIRPDGAAGPWLTVTVEDSGPGIALAEQERIFEPFVQVDDSATRSAGGAGLGLTISRQLARIMDGDLTVRSRPGVGSQFTLWLRAAIATLEPRSPSA